MKALVTNSLSIVFLVFSLSVSAQSITQKGKDKKKAAPTFETVFSPAIEASAIRTVCDTIAAWQFANPDYPKGRDFTALDWTSAAFYRGAANWGTVSGNERWRNILRSIGNANVWKLDTRPFHSDDHCVGQTWLDLYLEDQIENQRIPTETGLLAFANKQIRSLSVAPSDEEITWCDALFMDPPTMALMATASGDRKWFDRLEARWWNTTGYLFDAKEHLFYRDKSFFNKKEKNGQPVFWSRGNGWVMAGMVNILREMPQDYPGRDRMITLFKLMADRVVNLQLEDGSWHASLLDPDSYPVPETSGTAFFTYALLWGLNQGILPEQPYLDAAQKAWKRLVANVHANGKPGFIQRPGAAPDVTDFESNANYGTGAFLLAGSELLNYVELKSSVRAKIQAENKMTVPRLREVSSFPWTDAVKLIPGLTATNIAVRDLQSGQFVPTQVFDANGDNNPDELLFLTTLLPNQIKNYEIVKVAGIQPRQLPSRLSARYVPERKDDFAWENDRMAYRLYGPALAIEGSRGGTDVWSKRTRAAVVDRWYKTDAYHKDAGEGCDGFKVGPGMGVGGTGYMDKDGTIISSPVYATWKLMANGPLRIAFELTYPAIKVGSASIIEKRYITMNSGESFFKVEASFTVEGDATGIKPVAGIRSDDEIKPVSNRPLSKWCVMENISDGYVGLGLIVNNPADAQVGQKHLFVTLANDFSKPVSWYAGATWSKALDYTTPSGWDARISESTKRFADPVIVRVMPD